MNVNNFGPKSAMGADLAKQVKDLGKLDEKKGVGEAQQATAADRPEGDTEVNKTVVIDNVTGELVDKQDDGSGVIVWLLDGHYHKMEKDQKLHDAIMENFNIGDNLLDD